MQYEDQYAQLVEDVLINGEERGTRNATTYSTFGKSLNFDVRESLPLLTGRKIYYKGVLGELAAMLRGPKCVADFEKWGCNFWKQWAAEDGTLNLDYGNAWLANDQIEMLKTMLKYNNTCRRMLISGWRPENLNDLSLPCCHFNYQFYVSKGKVLHMIWTQRSADVMVGIPSNMVFAAAWLIAIAGEFGMTAGTVKMDFGDTHIYKSHESGARDYLTQSMSRDRSRISYAYEPVGKDFCLFEPKDLVLGNYNHRSPIKFELFE